jgi:hypothetical protein
MVTWLSPRPSHLPPPPNSFTAEAPFQVCHSTPPPCAVSWCGRVLTALSFYPPDNVLPYVTRTARRFAVSCPVAMRWLRVGRPLRLGLGAPTCAQCSPSTRASFLSSLRGPRAVAPPQVNSGTAGTQPPQLLPRGHRLQLSVAFGYELGGPAILPHKGLGGGCHRGRTVGGIC